jgi:hypothetical protein
LVIPYTNINIYIKTGRPWRNKFIFTNEDKGLKWITSYPGHGGKSYVFLYSEGGKELSFKSINAARDHFKVKWGTIKDNIDSNNWVTLQEEQWLISSTPRGNGVPPQGPSK